LDAGGAAGRARGAGRRFCLPPCDHGFSCRPYRAARTPVA
jgi:hypothetical protein